MIVIIGLGLFLFIQLKQELPSVKDLHQVQYQTPLRIYSRDHLLMAQFGEKKRQPITIKEIPETLIQAFLAAEDSRFYQHPGVDYQGILRAGFQFLKTGQKKQGGSTITMQVTRNFLLSREKTFKRKIREIVLALKIEQEFSKNEILELYLNKIYLGHRSYGIAAAAKLYYGKPLAELDLAEMAMLAGLPKAPSIYNPVTNPKRALIRRNYVLNRMLLLDMITQQAFDKAKSQVITAKIHHQNIELSAPYITEMVRQQMMARFGDKTYTSGLKVYTTIDSSLQIAATKAVHYALHQYDERHGYRGHNDINASDNPSAFLSTQASIGDNQPALVISSSQQEVIAQLKNQTHIKLTWKNIRWARPFKTRNSQGRWPISADKIMSIGDIIQVRQLDSGEWRLSQLPEVEGAFTALNPKNGALVALVGGFDFYHNKYNRATQSKRQPGSGFKPIIYTTALEQGFTAASLVNDAPIVIEGRRPEDTWRPENYSHRFYGPTRLRVGLMKSRNLVSIRLLQTLGIPAIVETATRFGFSLKQLPHAPSLALGSGYAAPLQMSRMYSVFANGGFLIKPYFIDRIESRSGEILFQATPEQACRLCTDTEEINKLAPRVITPQVNYLMNSLLRDVVQRGTATRAKILKRDDIAGKTGTTNDQRDAWFNGFTSFIVANAWVGFDNSATLGAKETGGKTALPMWIHFMKEALKDRPQQPLLMPEGMTKIAINSKTGLRLTGQKTGIIEYFREEHIPETYSLNSFTADESIETEVIDELF